MNKSATRRIVISEPDAEHLESDLRGRELDPALVSFLTNLIRTNKWTRKLNIPSSRNDLAAALVFRSELKTSGIEVFSELHVFLAGKVRVERWRVMGEREQTRELPTAAFASVNILKVRENDSVVRVHLQVPVVGAQSKLLVHTFDFGHEEPATRNIPHPLFESHEGVRA